MKKKSSIFLLSLVVFIIQFNTYAQNLESSLRTCGDFNVTSNSIDLCQNSTHFSLDENYIMRHKQEDVFVDRFGNTHHKKINIDQIGYQKMIPTTPDYISPEGLFAIYLDDQVSDNSILDFNNDANYRNVVAQIFADLEQLIIENPATGVLEPVKIELQSIYSNSSSALASASSYYNYNGLPPGTIVNGEVWKAINSGSNDSNSWDGFIKVNFFHSWYTNFSNPTAINGTNSFDMYAVLLHEIMHALGFASGIDNNGNPKNGNAFLTYDNLLHTDLGVDLIVPSGSSWLYNGTLSTNVITNGCPNTSEVRLGDNDLFVHTPQTYSSGSSLSHIDLDNDCLYPVTDYIMAYAVSVETPRRPITQEFDILCDLNYNLATQYGNNNVVEFSNPAIVTTANNHTSNIVTYASCNPEVFGLDDFTDVTTQPTIDNCQGSVLSILEQDLLSNDVSNLGLTLEVSNLSLNGGLITTFTGIAPNRTFLITPNTVGNLQLVYKPMDANGNLGNDTYANIVVTICNSLNCINTSSCNLICNPEFIDPTPGNIGTYNPFDMAYHMNANGNGPSELDGWFAFNGSVSYYDFSLPQWVGTPEVPVNYFNLPGSTGEGAIALYGCGSSQPNNGEALLTKVNVYNNVNYLLSINRNRWVADRACSYQVYLSDENAITSGNPYAACTGTVDVLAGFPLQTIASENNITSNQWEQSLFCFTADDDYQSLILNAYSASTSGSHVLIDNIELIEDKFITNSANIQTTFDLICGQDANLGQELCLVSSLEYQFWDVTDASNVFQLTNGLITPSYTVSDLVNSEVILNNIYADINIELRRVFVNANSVPININTCNTILPITINVEPEAPTDASFTNTIYSNCLTYVFQANEIYDTHEWDFDNDGIIDVSGPGSNTANTNPTFTFSGFGTHTVTHIVYNECGSLTYQEDITINCPTICASTTTWTAGSWDNGLPDLTKEVIINSNYNTANNGSFSACSLIVNDTFILDIAALDYVEVDFNTTIHGELLVKDKGSFVQKEESGFFILQGNGKATAEKMTAISVSNTEVTYFSFPINSSTVGELFLNNPFIDSYRYWYNTANFQDSCYETFNDNSCIPGNGIIYDGVDDDGDDWIFASNTFVMEPGIGLITRANTNAPALFNFTGSFNNGIINVPVTRNDEEVGDDNSIFVGNPFPSAIDADVFLQRNMKNHPSGTNTDGVIDGIIYIWSHHTPASGLANGNQALNFDASDYAMINLTGEIVGGDNIMPNRFIPSTQGFFVNYSDSETSTTGAVVFNNAMRVTQNNDQFFKTTDNLENKIWLEVSSQTGVHSQVLLGYVSGATSALDALAYDAFEHSPLGQNALLYFNIPQSNKKFVIQGKAPSDLNINEVVSIGFFNSTQETSPFTIKIEDFQGDFFNNATVYLRDNVLNTCHNLSSSSYSFTSIIGEFNNRFELLFENCNTLNVSENEINSFNIYPNPVNDIINIESKNPISSLNLYNGLGQLVLNNTNLNYLNVSNISDGLYFLNIEDVKGNIKNVRIIKGAEN